MKRYTDAEAWSYIRGLPLAVDIAMSTEGARVLQQVVDDWAADHGGKEKLEKEYYDSIGVKY